MVNHMLHVYIYTKKSKIFASESQTIRSFFVKYNTKCNIKCTSNYETIINEILDIDIIFVYDDVWDTIYNIIELQPEELDRSNKEFYIIKSSFPIKIEKLEKNKNKLIPKDKIICLKAKNEIIRIPSKKIIYFENVGRTVYVHTVNDIFKIETHIRDLRIILEREAYIASYVSILVNLYWIKDIIAYEIILKNGEKLPLSQKKSAAFRKIYKTYLRQISNEV